MVDLDANAARRQSTLLGLGILVLVLLAGTAGAVLNIERHLDPEPVLAEEPADLRYRIPGSVVTSNGLRLEGFSGRITAHLEGDRQARFVRSGRDEGRRLIVPPGQRIQLRTRVPPFGSTSEVVLVAGSLRHVWKVSALEKKPSAALAPKADSATPGQLVWSGYMAPEGFPPGTELVIDGGPYTLVTKHGREPNAKRRLDPGDIFQLGAPAPETGSRIYTIRLGSRKATWTVSARRADSS